MSDVPTIATRDEAVAFLDARIGHGIKPGLERIIGLLDLMGDPQLAFSIIHVAGTNGKTTVTRLVADILGAHGYRTGTFTSPHLHRVEERISIDGEPLTGEAFAAAVADISWFVEEYERRSGSGVTYFELTAALALSTFAASAIDVAVLEVGLGGRLDATNAVASDVAVVTGIAMDHVEFLGATIAEIAAEKAAIIDNDGIVVTGPLPPAAEGAVTARVAETKARWFRSGDDFVVSAETVAVGGWVADIEGVYAPYADLYLPVHGRHQVTNLATAIAASEVFLDHALDEDALRTAVSATVQPGRIEVVGRRPLAMSRIDAGDTKLRASSRILLVEKLDLNAKSRSQSHWTSSPDGGGPETPILPLELDRSSGGRSSAAPRTSTCWNNGPLHGAPGPLHASTSHLARAPASSSECNHSPR